MYAKTAFVHKSSNRYEMEYEQCTKLIKKLSKKLNLEYEIYVYIS